MTIVPTGAEMFGGLYTSLPWNPTLTFQKILSFSGIRINVESLTFTNPAVLAGAVGTATAAVPELLVDDASESEPP